MIYWRPWWVLYLSQMNASWLELFLFHPFLEANQKLRGWRGLKSDFQADDIGNLPFPTGYGGA